MSSLEGQITLCSCCRMQECLQEYITSSYPNLHVAVMLMLFALLPLSSVSYKRSASALHNPHTYQRCNKLCSNYHPISLIDVRNTNRVGVGNVHVCETYMYIRRPRRLDVRSLLANYEQIPTENLLLHMCLSSPVSVFCAYVL